APRLDPPMRLTSDQGFGTVLTMSHLEQRTYGGGMRHRTMAEYALEQLRESIILGELPAGTPLRLDELARSLGMSISPIREAVRQLEALGLAKHVPHQGARVLDFDIDELRDLFQVRLALESLAVRRAAERFTEQDATSARVHLYRFDESRATGDVRRTLRAHSDFHFALYEASQSQWLVAPIPPPWVAARALPAGAARRGARAAGPTPGARRAAPRRVRGARPGRRRSRALQPPRAGERDLRARARRQGHLRAGLTGSNSGRTRQARQAVPRSRVARRFTRGAWSSCRATR